MDPAAWLDRLRSFVAKWQQRLPPERQAECFVRADPPLSPDQVSQLRAELDRPLPSSVELFLTRATSRLRFHCPLLVNEQAELVADGELFNYWLWTPEQRPYEEQFHGAQEGMPEAREVALAIADNLGDPESFLDRAFWYHSLPLMMAPNTDALGLWAYEPDLSEPPVLALNHDADSFPLAVSFDAFLEQMELLGYDWGESYIDPQTRVMDVGSPEAVTRRKLLQLPG